MFLNANFQHKYLELHGIFVREMQKYKMLIEGWIPRQFLAFWQCGHVEKKT
jgi:hypothetical protein